MKYLKLFEEKKLNEYSAPYYIGVDLEEALNWCSGIPTPTDNMSLYPVDLDVIKYSNDEVRNMSEEEVEEYVKDVCPWYNGSMQSIIGGLNLLGDFENAKGYGDFILGIESDGDIADFSDQYSFLQNAKDAEVVFVYDKKMKKFISPEFFRDIKKYNL